MNDQIKATLETISTLQITAWKKSWNVSAQ